MKPHLPHVHIMKGRNGREYCYLRFPGKPRKPLPNGMPMNDRARPR